MSSSATMKSFVLILSLSLTASARYAFPHSPQRFFPRQAQECCFDLNSNGPVNGTVGQLPDGQIRTGPAFNESSTFCIQNGKIVDGNGRGCVITDADQFQCDAGSPSTPGFCIDNNGYLDFNGSETFYACPVDDNGNYNFYTQPVVNQTKCVVTSLNTVNNTCIGSCGNVTTTPPSSSSMIMNATMSSSSMSSSSMTMNTTTSSTSTPCPTTTVSYNTTTTKFSTSTPCTVTKTVTPQITTSPSGSVSVSCSSTTIYPNTTSCTSTFTTSVAHTVMCNGGGQCQ